ncbi:hypothetical protein Acr_02g0014190 [Actinidia rufa]|uniref:CCHC-type domain-containing protein n=1 Tax=Actinidia rufa TaxID=165716 RepID=A0A7J0EB76_9ERIC|nr:hypothetical protein Acr_02g0014190 [Actinidia rufa]
MAKLDGFWVTTSSQSLLILLIHIGILTIILSWDGCSTPWRTGFTTCSFIMTLFIAALSQMYAHASQEITGFLSCIGRLQELHKRPWDSLSPTILASFTATIVSQQLARQNTYQFLMGLKSEYESLHIQILNTSPLPSLYEAFAIIDGDEHRHRLIQTSPTISSGSTPIADQMAFAASGSGPRSSGDKPICSYCGNIGHIRERCFNLHPELKRTPSKRKGKGPCTTTVAETSPGHVPDLSHIQSQLGSLLQQQPLSSTATIAIGTPSLPGSDAEIIPTNLDELPCPIPLFDSPSVQVPTASATRAPLKVYTRRAPPSTPLPDSSSVSGTSPSHLVPTFVSPRYPSRTRYPPDRFGFSSCTNHPIAKKGKTGWILGHHLKPTTSDPTYPQWDIDIYCKSFTGVLGTICHSVANYFGLLQSRWEELAQHEPLSDFPSVQVPLHWQLGLLSKSTLATFRLRHLCQTLFQYLILLLHI